MRSDIAKTSVSAHLGIDLRKRALHRRPGRHDVAAAPDRPADPARRGLGVGLIVGAGPGVLAFFHASELDRADHAHDLQPGDSRPGTAHVFRLRSAMYDAAADRVPIGPEPRREVLVDDHDPRGAGGVGIAEEAAPPHRHLQGVEIARRHIQLIGREDRFTGLRGIAFGDDDAAAPVLAEWQVAADSGGLDARERPHPRQRARRHTIAARRRRDSARRAG